ncbi:hypothetical protein PL81_02540 [Streptomyces sp. RSD-27]|nr:hypothetical protein PL81_02540 [Streptomyces sp. RSD-27]
MTARAPKKTALVLIDVENAIGALAQPPVALARLTAFLEHAPAEALVVAACPPSRLRPDVERVLADHGVKVLSAGTGPDAADKVLLNRARQAAAEGVRHFTVVSADAAFAALAPLGELHVLAWDTQPVGKRLAAAASVHRIPRVPGPSPAPPRPAPSGAPAPAPTAPTAPTPQEPPADPTPPANPPRPRSTARWGGTAVAALFCGGVALGAGTALGSRLVHLALDTLTRPRT